MKILNYLLTACILWGMCACHNDNEKNDDLGTENKIIPKISFKDKSITVDENAGTLNIPLNLTEATDVAIVVSVAIKKGSLSGGVEGAPYATIPAEVTLEKGATEGVITLQIVDNQTPNPDCNFDLQLTKVEGEIQIDTTAAICRVIIVDDEVHHSVRLGKQGKDSGWPEEAGIIEVPLIFTYGDSDEKAISGTITVDSTYGCSASDFEILTTNFTANGEDTLKVKVKLVNNETVGKWGFRLALKDLKGAWSLTPNYMVNVNDDDRLLGFKLTTYKVDEGANLDVIPYLYGGLASRNIPLQVEVVPGETTAFPAQYSLPKTINAIYANTQSSSFILKTFKHSSREDKVLTLKITTTVAGPRYDTTQMCKIIIKSTDPFVRFAKKEVSGLIVGKNSIPLETSGYDEDTQVYINVKSSTMDAADYKLVSGFIRIPADLKSGNIELELTKAMQPGDEIKLEITSVVLGNSGIANDEIDPDKNICTCFN